MAVHPLRGQNRSRLLNEIINNDVRSRPQLAQRLGLSLMAVTRITRELIDVGLIDEGIPKTRPDLSGRPPSELTINPSGAYTLGLGIYAYEQSAVLVDLTGKVLRRCDLEPCAAGQSSDCLLIWARQIQRELIGRDVDPLRILGAGVAISGNVEAERGVLLDAPYLGWARTEIAAPLREQLKLPVFVSGTAHALLAASRRALGGTLDNALLFNVGFAIGGGLLVDGRIARGARFTAGQVGHLQADRTGRRCSCGQKGCLNAVASGWAALADLGEVDVQTSSAEDFRAGRTKLVKLLRRERKGEADACKALWAAGQQLGRTAAQLFIALDPGRIFLSGPVGLTTSFFEGVKSGFAAYDQDILERCDVKFDAAAASLALQEFVFSPKLDFDRLRQAASSQEAA
jgi:predicted NBD/HSP70 family sugar kinase